MKKLIAFFAALTIAALANAAPDEFRIVQRDSTDTFTYTRIVPPPNPFTQSSVLMFDQITGLPVLGAISGLTWDGTTLSAAAGVQADWTAAAGAAQILNKPALALVATSGSYSDLSNKPTIPTVSPFNFSQPTSRTIAVSTSYQASDVTKAAVIYPSLTCQNSTTLLASSACTAQVRMGASALTCSTGVPYTTLSATVNLGLVFTAANTIPSPILLPIGGYFIVCPTAGTFTTTAVEQSAG